MSDRRLERREGLWIGRFEAMASPCELHVEVEDQILAGQLLAVAADEAGRIERKYSRYLPDNPIHAINGGNGFPVTVDEETAGLLDFAARCHELSQGRFDITAGVLRRLWRFDGGDDLPSRKQVKELLPLIGWEKVNWSRPGITLKPGMEIDLGGIGKEYAVDRTLALLEGETAAPMLLNFGGDLRVSDERKDGRPWRVAIEDPGGNAPDRAIEIRSGALATSGDSRRFLFHRGVRYSHILNPRTGWPIANAPRSVTVAAPTCTEAGMIATFAMLRGGKAEAFLVEQEITHWCLR